MQEFTGEQLNRIDEIYDAVLVVVKLMMDIVPNWDIVSETADVIAEFIHKKTNNPIHFPTATEDENGNRTISDYMFDKEAWLWVIGLNRFSVDGGISKSRRKISTPS